MIILNYTLQLVYTYRQQYLNQNIDVNITDIADIDSKLLTNVTNVYQSDGIVIYLLNNGSLYGLGRNDYYQISDEDNIYYTQPKLIDENVTKCALGYRFVTYIKNGQLNIKGHFQYDSIDLSEQINNLYASSFTIIISTQLNNYFYIGKNPQYDEEQADSIFYSISWQQLQFDHTIKKIQTQQEIITIIDSAGGKHLYGTRTKQFESTFTKNDIVSTNSKNQVKYLASNGIITTYGNIMNVLGQSSFTNVDLQDLKDICLMNNQIAFIYNNASADIYSDSTEIQHVNGLDGQLQDSDNLQILCDNDKFTLITTVKADIIIPRNTTDSTGDDDKKVTNKATLTQSIILVVLILISLGLIAASIVMLVFVKTDKLDKQLGPKEEDTDKQTKKSKKQSKQQSKLQLSTVQNNVSTANLEDAHSITPKSKVARNDLREEAIEDQQQKIYKPITLPQVQNQQLNVVQQSKPAQQPVQQQIQLPMSLKQEQPQQKQVQKTISTFTPQPLSIINQSDIQQIDQQLNNNSQQQIPKTNQTVKKIIVKKKVKRVQKPKQEDQNQQNLDANFDDLLNFGNL